MSVAIGELAPGLRIDLDRVPKKYAGLDGTELAISESQERMAIVVAPKDVDQMLAYAQEENLEAVPVAEVTEEPRLVMSWRGKVIVDISRAFLDTNGAHQETAAAVTMPDESKNYFRTGASYESVSHKKKMAGEAKDTDEAKQEWLSMLADLNVCSKKGLVEMFDSSIGAATVTMPYGGKYQLTPIQTMTAKLPVLCGACDTVTMMSYGYDPFLSSWSPYHGAVYAVISSVAKIVAAGGDYRSIRFTFQEYFRRLGSDPKRWGEPLAALLGAYQAQIKLGLPSIGGKDSMSGTFNDIDVPPTLVSFAVNVTKADNVISPEFKKAGNALIVFPIQKDAYDLPDYESLLELYDKLTTLHHEKTFVSAYALGAKGIAEAVSKMAFGNGLGARIHAPKEKLFAPSYGDILVEMDPADVKKLDQAGISYLEAGEVIAESRLECGEMKLELSEALGAWTDTLESVFPTRSGVPAQKVPEKLYDAKTVYTASHKIAKPKVFIPVFPGTNCEYDTLQAFERAGAKVNTVVFRNLNETMIRESVEQFEKAIREAQIVMFPGGFSAGDEPDGSGKFIATAFRNPRISDAVNDLLKQRDGLVLGICNGFQAIIKLGLVPYGEITPQHEDSPTLTTNHIGRHISKSVYTKVVSNQSPWLRKAKLGGVYAIPASHGEGRFAASEEWLRKLMENGQIATQYVDVDGTPTMDEDYNPNGSYYAIEGITSPDGRVLGKMAHSERRGAYVAENITGCQNQYIFESGVEYFR